MREGWKTVSLGDVCVIDKTKYKDGEMPYVGMEDIISGKGKFVGSREPKKVGSSTFRFTPEHLLYGRLRPYLNKVLLPDFEGHCSSEIFPLLPKVGLDKSFLFYWITSERVVKEINRTCTGTRMPRANVNEVLKLDISLPTLPEQKRIVAILDEAFAGIDTAIANTEKNLANARELFESYLNSVFSQRSDGWEKKNLGDICENLDSKRKPITKSKRESGSIPYYGASGVVDYLADYLFDENLLLVSEDGANLLARTYPIAFSISGKTWVNNHAHVLRFETMSSQKFVEYYLNSISLSQYVSGMAQPKLNQKSLNSIKIPFPDDDIKHSVVEKLDELSVETKRLQDSYKIKLNSLKELKQSLLQKAFTGELTAKADKLIDEAVA